MSILGFVEKKLGSLHNWPQDLLRYLFRVIPTSYTTLEVAAFFYGNKIPRDTALEFFQECNDPSSQNIEIFCEKYEIWQRCEEQTCTNTMSIGLNVYIKGSDYHQCELVENDWIHIAIGFGDSFPDNIKKE
jgi:hypothetical protein